MAGAFVNGNVSDVEQRKLTARDEFESRFILFSETVERFLVKAITVAVVLMLIFQSLLLHDGIRQYVSKVDKTEGIRLDDLNPQR